MSFKVVASARPVLTVEEKRCLSPKATHRDPRRVQLHCQGAQKDCCLSASSIWVMMSRRRAWVPGKGNTQMLCPCVFSSADTLDFCKC